jgi:CBS domain containing-hemolysin-like protein
MWIDALIILALIAVNGIFSGAEIATLSVRKTRLRELLESGKRGARAVQALRDQPERQADWLRARGCRHRLSVRGVR